MAQKRSRPSEYKGPPPDSETSGAAIDALQAQLNLVSGNLDSIDGKAALVPPFLVVLATLVLPASPWTAQQQTYATWALVAGLISTLAIAAVLLPGDNAIGPSADEMTADLGGPLATYRVRIAMSLKDAVNAGSARTHRKATWFKFAAIAAAVAILLVIRTRFP